MFNWLFGKGKHGGTRPPSGTTVLVCVLDPKFTEVADADADAYKAYYPHVTCRAVSSLSELTDTLKQHFTVVHMFCDVEETGKVRGLGISGTHLIRKCQESDVKLLWIASDNATAGYISGFNPKGQRISLVMTIRRRDGIFEAFLRDLLARLAEGRTLPLAWAELSPQSPKAPEQAYLPETIYYAGGGQLKLR